MLQWQPPFATAAADAPYLSSCENGFLVSQVQGVFANALSVSSYLSSFAKELKYDDTESAFAKTPWTCETRKPFSQDER